MEKAFVFNMAPSVARCAQFQLIAFSFIAFQNKLDGYRAEEESGKELSSEQEKAVSKYDEVVQQLSLSKEFYKQFQVIASAASKDAKREARKVNNKGRKMIPTRVATTDFISFRRFSHDKLRRR